MNNSVPVWLESHPRGLTPDPPVETRSQELPFQELQWEDFERLILRIVRQDSRILDCQIYGTKGQAQEGLDILASKNGDKKKSVCYQCKQTKVFGASDIRSAVDKFVEGRFSGSASEFVLCASASLNSTNQVDEIANQRKRLQKIGVNFRVWDGSASGRLCDILKLSPLLVDDFFGRPWVVSFNGQSAVDEFGERMSAAELSKLRPRLLDLYTTVFNQHDPGIRSDTSNQFNYLYRYVLADVLESTKILPGQSNALGQSSPEITNESDSQAQDKGLQVAGVAKSHELRKRVTSWLQDQQNQVLIGDPGSGKSAFLRFLSLALLSQDESLSGQLHPSQLRRLPVWISFAAFSNEIEQNDSISVEDFFHGWLHKNSFDDVSTLFSRALNHSEVLLLIDGLDEAVSEHHAQVAIDRLVAFAKAKGSHVLCTCRPRGFSTLGVPSDWATASLAPMSYDQIKELSNRWFALTEYDTSSDEQFKLALQQSEGRAQEFLATVQSSSQSYQLARTPLLCQTMIELFRSSHQLPEDRVSLYEEILSLLLRRHPGARARAAGKPPRGYLSQVNSNDLREIALRVAWHMQSAGPTIVIAKDKCQEICEVYLSDDIDGLGLDIAGARQLARVTSKALVSTYGLLVEKSPEELSFFHLSMQEFLAAEALTRRPKQEQLDWISQIWMDASWRECLVNWFGIQAVRGMKTLAGQSADLIEAQSKSGQLESMNALELLTSLTCKVNGLPMNRARDVVQKAAVAIEKSPFSEHRTTLAKSLTIGALGSSVQRECSQCLQRWMPGRPAQTRAEIFKALIAWTPASDLREYLLKGLHDREGICRRAAAETLGKKFNEDQELPGILEGLSINHTRSEVRAAALRALLTNENWQKLGIKCANENLDSNSSELLLEVTRIRVFSGAHDDGDLNRMYRLLSTESIDFWQKNEFVEVLVSGWPRDDRLKRRFIDSMQNRATGRPDKDILLTYLVRTFPGDNEVAATLGSLLRNHGLHLLLDSRQIWLDVLEGFRGHQDLIQEVRTALREHKDKYESIHWYPAQVYAYAVIGDDEVRDELIQAFQSTDDHSSRRWIAEVLEFGWPKDEVVHESMKSWSQSSIETSAPLARFSERLFTDEKERRQWLEKLVKEAKGNSVVSAIRQLIESFPDKEAYKLAQQNLGNDIWYYNRIDLEARIAALKPDEESSVEVFERALTEVDGPPIGVWVSSVEQIAALRFEVLNAATPGSSDVRMAIASTLSIRRANFDQLTELVPRYLAESDAGVRSNILIALAQASDVQIPAGRLFYESLLSEIKSVGMVHSMRRRTALSALLEIEKPESGDYFTGEGVDQHWINQLIDYFDQDAASLSNIIKHWNKMKELLQSHLPDARLPIDGIIHAGFGQLLIESGDLESELNTFIDDDLTKELRPEYLDLLARLRAGSPFLRELLIDLITSSNVGYVTSLSAVHHLSDQFSEDKNVISEVLEQLSEQSRIYGPPQDGVLGYLAFGWSDEKTISSVQELLPNEMSEWGTRDRLLFSIATKDEDTAESCVKELLSEPLWNWRYREFDVSIIRNWANDEISSKVLAKWVKSNNATLSMTAVLISGFQQTSNEIDIDSLIKQFNHEFVTPDRPFDGLDVLSRTVRSWCEAVYPVLAHKQVGIVT
ncbi:MAG: hypothetical protein DRR42_04235 [Gammaproteobacteria bacterium]|nr:MAG: hypothetical protein DRR42_04235 [Gammaproteobacteria bacterium]